MQLDEKYPLSKNPFLVHTSSLFKEENLFRVYSMTVSDVIALVKIDDFNDSNYNENIFIL